MPSQGQAHRTLGRKSGPRKMLLRQLVTSVIEHESITTTYARAKEAQPLVEKMITHSKQNTRQDLGAIAGFVFNVSYSLKKLRDVLAPRYKNRQGGYTRVLHLEPRGRDAAPMAVLELVDGKKDLRLYLTAKAIARSIHDNIPLDKTTLANKAKYMSTPEGAQLLQEKTELLQKVFYP
ncbi:ribosomal protein L17 [Lipomyces arxii]|uniref:mitochondrial 54S ribosomal protein bL17m n=1 Tax=Lipomyces arxii TaxID=56418 RepID=UPI0034CDF924